MYLRRSSFLTIQKGPDVGTRSNDRSLHDARLLCVGVVFLCRQSLWLHGRAPRDPDQLVSAQGAAIEGKVRGGQQPVSGATIQLYAVGTTGDASSATPLITTTLTTSDGTGQMNSNANAGNANNSLPTGSFTISGDYTCPSATSEAYFVATGGNPGLAPGINNTDISLMAALGQCGNLAGSTTIVVNELTTISTINSLLNFMISYANVGSGTSDATQLQSAFSLVNEYTNISNGTVPGTALPTGYSASSTAIQTLADVVAACVNSGGGVAGDGSACGNLFKLATISGNSAPTEIVAAILDILNQPTVNVGPIYQLLTPEPPFEPTLTSPPANWYLPITSNVATQLVFAVPPANSAAGTPLSPAVAVAVEDASGNIQASATNAVTLAIGSNPGAGTLSGATTVSAVNGVATFSNLTINNVGSGYTLTASTAGLPTTTGPPFNVTTTAPKIITLIAVAPATANLGVGINQQYGAIGTYNDGSTADVTSLASWSSSSTSMATVNSQGLVQTVSPGDVNIIATVGSVQGSAPLTVNSATDGLVEIDDMTDPRLVSYTSTDGSTAMLYGDRDSNGNPSALTGVSGTDPQGNQGQLLLDSQGLPQSVTFSDGSHFLYSWSSNTAGIASVFGSDGVATISAPISAPQTLAVQSAARARALKSDSSEGTTSPTGAASITVYVTSCNAATPEDYATVVAAPPGGNIPLPLISSGEYGVALATGTAALSPGLQADKQVLDNICYFPNLLGNACKVLTATVVLAGEAFPVVEAPEIYAACSNLGTFGNIISKTCSAISAGNTYNSVTTWLSDQLPLPVSVSLTGQTPQIVTVPISGGRYTANVNLPCPAVDHVDVIPSNVTISPGEEIPLIATARNSNDQILASSAFNFAWSGSSVDLLSSPEFQGDDPFGTDDVAGISAGGPVTITATEINSNKSRSSEITVAQPAYTFTTLSYPEARQTFPSAINNLGQVVGQYQGAGGLGHGFLYDSGNYSLVEPLGAGYSAATGINNNSQIVGWANLTTGFLYYGGSYTNLNGPANGINDAGQIVGNYSNSQYYLYSGGSYTPLTLPGYPNGINNAGLIIGVNENGGYPEGFLYNPAQPVQTISAPNSGCLDYLYGINNSDAIVGYEFQGALPCAENGLDFIYSAGTFTPVSPNPGWSQFEVTGINDFGMIVGTYADTNQNIQGFIGVPQRNLGNLGTKPGDIHDK